MSHAPVVGHLDGMSPGLFFLDRRSAPANVEPRNIEPVVQALRGVNATHSLQASLEAGEIIFRHVFEGDEQVLRARGKKCSSFRRLAAHPELKMSPSSLWRAVAVYELSRRFPEIAQYTHTGVGHVSVVFGLPAAEQFRLLRLTEAQRWTRRYLQKVAREVRRAHRAGGGVPRCRLIEQLEGLDMMVRDANADPQLPAIEECEARRALGLMEDIRMRLQDIEGRVSAALGSSPIP